MCDDLKELLGKPKPTWHVMIAGATAGVAVDTSLYPIDTIKARLQSKLGFFKTGGFTKLYRGITPVLAGSVPNSTLFFVTYESLKQKLFFGDIANQMIAGSFGEVASCVVRVPYEILKVRSQTSVADRVRNLKVIKEIFLKEGPIGFYRGFFSTVIRDVPFSAIQYPLWEMFKRIHLERNRVQVNATQSAWYGCIAGGIAAFITTPLDVAKTRIMLADKAEALSSGRISLALRLIYRESGVRGLFAGVLPRVIWISVGAAIFLGSYEKTLMVLEK